MLLSEADVPGTLSIHPGSIDSSTLTCLLPFCYALVHTVNCGWYLGYHKHLDSYTYDVGQ